MNDDPNWRAPLNYEPTRRPRGPDRLFSMAKAGQLLGLINCAWAGIGALLSRLFSTSDLRALLTILLCGVIPSAIVGVLLAFTSMRNEQRWLIFLTNAGALLFVSFLLLSPM